MAALEAIGYDDYITAELPVDKDNPEETVHGISDDMNRIIAGNVLK